jgi:DNA-binding transcriptional regulator YhcF (GntR family)
MLVDLTMTSNADADMTRGCVRAGLQYFVATVGRVVDMTGGHLVDGVILITLLSGNVAPLVEKDGLAFAAQNEIPPDNLRKPVTVYALAKQLRLPYETARRHVQRLEDRGLCVRVAREGLIVPQAVVDSLAPSHGLKAMMHDLSELMARLGALGALTSQATGLPQAGSQANWIG